MGGARRNAETEVRIRGIQNPGDKPRIVFTQKPRPTLLCGLWVEPDRRVSDRMRLPSWILRCAQDDSKFLIQRTQRARGSTETGVGIRGIQNPRDKRTSGSRGRFTPRASVSAVVSVLNPIGASVIGGRSGASRQSKIENSAADQRLAGAHGDERTDFRHVHPGLRRQGLGDAAEIPGVLCRHGARHAAGAGVVGQSPNSARSCFR
jgi:hypothetical protein